jgi:DNA-binding Lrp family transcriptional regulator
MQVRLRRQTANLLEEFERLACGLSNVTHCYHVSGVWNYVLHVSSGSPQKY